MRAVEQVSSSPEQPSRLNIKLFGRLRESCTWLRTASRSGLENAATRRPVGDDRRRRPPWRDIANSQVKVHRTVWRKRQPPSER